MASFLSRFFGGSARLNVDKRFELICPMGRGTMSKVYRARDRQSGQEVALKLLNMEVVNKFNARFKGMNKPSEGEIAISLSHPNIVKTLEHGITTDNVDYLVMEYIKGMDLAVYVETQNQTMQELRIDWMLQLGDGLNHIHKQGWIHRDFCPKNVIITDARKVKLIDFGLMVPDKPEFRAPGNRTGTLTYMAPELMKRQPTDQRIDVFSYAVTCYEMWAKRYPWEAGKSLETTIKTINQPPLQLTEVSEEITPEMAAVVMKGLENSPARRWQSVAEMVDAIRQSA